MSRRGVPSGLAWQIGHAYTLHLWPPYGDPDGKQQAGHYTGWAHQGRLAHRLVDHHMGRGARLTQLQKEVGGSWVVADVEDDVTRDREHQLKYRSASQRCTVCKSVKAYEAGKATAAEALTRAGWDRSNAVERKMLLEIFHMEASPPGMNLPAPVSPSPSVPAPRLSAGPREPSAAELAEMDALVDDLVTGWTTTPKAPEPEREAEYELG